MDADTCRCGGMLIQRGDWRERDVPAPGPDRPARSPDVAASRARGARLGRAAQSSNARHEGTGWHPAYPACGGCGSTVVPPLADGLCVACWRAARGLAGAVEAWGGAGVRHG